MNNNNMLLSNEGDGRESTFTTCIGILTLAQMNSFM